jgi:2,3-bisphosphoglycerate-dependent phosphoglycerate mutase
MYKVVFMRHGESIWNKENKFTGWTDIDLSDVGKIEAVNAGLKLKENKFMFDIAYTSVLKRAIKTLWELLDVMDLAWIPIIKNWKLNERHYGNLQGMNKKETEIKYGKEQVKIWRRSYDTMPIKLEEESYKYLKDDIKYKGIHDINLPLAESLKDTVSRVVPYWNEEIVKQIKNNKKVIIVAHGNSLRALVKYINRISDSDIVNVNIPTAIPVVYEFDNKMSVLNSYYL